jgi:hypothetical protein
LSEVFLFLSGPQLYLFLILSSYGTAQRRDQYDPVDDPSQPLTTIPPENSDPWDLPSDEQPATAERIPLGSREFVDQQDLNSSSLSMQEQQGAYGHTGKQSPFGM